MSIHKAIEYGEIIRYNRRNLEGMYGESNGGMIPGNIPRIFSIIYDDSITLNRNEAFFNDYIKSKQLRVTLTI